VERARQEPPGWEFLCVARLDEVTEPERRAQAREAEKSVTLDPRKMRFA